MILRPLSFVLACIALFTSGCATWYDARFVPAPLEMRLSDSATPELEGRALISVVGVRRPDGQAGTPAQFELALRLENLGQLPFRIDTAAFELVTADLESLSGARLRPDPLPELAPGGSAQLELVFPLPEGRKIGEYDLSGLNLRWALLYGERRMVMGASFQRDLPLRYHWGYYDPFYDACGWRTHVGLGVHVGRFHAY